MISLEWVSDYIDLKDQDLKELAVKITKAGINVEKVISNDIPNLVIGKVINCIPHPNSDHMHICEVDVGKEKLVQIVCGASNVKAGIKVIVALEGAKLPGGEIKKTELRGVQSNGMICALCEVGLEENTKENYAKGIFVAPDNLKVGAKAIPALGLETTLYELDIHKHRNNDCYYHIGFAYEIASILNRKVKLPDMSYKTNDDDVSNYLSLEVDTPKCPYYTGRMATNLTIKESPEFIKKRLLAAGMHPINNVVDISNYVMLEFGQPLHFFDKDTLGEKILVRNAYEDEKLVTLDNNERTLKTSDIVITDGKKPICLAGVMGGLDTEVTPRTKNIFMEAAIFDNISIRNTANRLNLKSEASIRYGKGLSYEYTNYALDRACHLLEKYADATILKGTIKHDKLDKTPKVVTFKEDDISKLLGIDIKPNDIEHELDRLEFPYEFNNNSFTVTIPNRRLDIDPNVNDIAEEIVRLYGYENLVCTLPRVEIKQGEYKGDVKYRKIIASRLRTLGLTETRTYTLTSPSMASTFNYEGKTHLNLPNPMSIDKSVLRTSLIPSMLNVYNYNKARKVNDMFLYEISKTYDVNYTEESKIAILMKGNYIINETTKVNVPTDFYLIKGVVENLLDYLGFAGQYKFVKSEIPSMHPKRSAMIYLQDTFLGIIGEVHPSISKDEIYVCEISLNKLMQDIKPLKYVGASIYPEIVKDVAFVVDKKLPVEEIMTTIKDTGKDLLTNISIFDIYMGPNVLETEKSVAFKLTFQSKERTLSDEEVMKIFNQIMVDVKEKFNCKVRDN